MGNTQLNQDGAPVTTANPLPVTSAAIGAAADTAATTDTGTFSLIALIKRGLQSLTKLVGLVTRVTLVRYAAPDTVDTFTYSDAGTADERIATIVHSSASLSLSYTETFAYLGSAGAYRINTVTRS